jgi:hypothetical protein
MTPMVKIEGHSKECGVAIINDPILSKFISFVL